MIFRDYKSIVKNLGNPAKRRSSYLIHRSSQQGFRAAVLFLCDIAQHLQFTFQSTRSVKRFGYQPLCVKYGSESFVSVKKRVEFFQLLLGQRQPFKNILDR